MMEKLLQLDTELFLFFNGLRAPWADRAVYLISKGWFWLPLFLLIIYLIFRIYKRRGWIVLAVFALTIALSDQTCNLVRTVSAAIVRRTRRRFRSKSIWYRNQMGIAISGVSMAFRRRMPPIRWRWLFWSFSSFPKAKNG